MHTITMGATSTAAKVFWGAGRAGSNTASARSGAQVMPHGKEPGSFSQVQVADSEVATQQHGEICKA